MPTPPGPTSRWRFSITASPPRISDGRDGTACTDPTPNAILRIQRLQGNHWGRGVALPQTCPPITNAAGVVTPLSTDYEPNVLFDPREGLLRDMAPAGTNVTLGGVMHYITLDVANLTRWFGAVAPYTARSRHWIDRQEGQRRFHGLLLRPAEQSRRREPETGEYGWEDFVNPEHRRRAATPC